jgi:hypothetical protein
LVAMVCLTAALPVRADQILLKAELRGNAVVPGNSSPALGTVTVTYDTAKKRLTWKGTYSGLTGPAISAHFHGPAGPGSNAGAVVTIASPGPRFEGAAELSEAQANDLLAGRFYVDIKTATHPAGELRGQVEK